MTASNYLGFAQHVLDAGLARMRAGENGGLTARLRKTLRAAKTSAPFYADLLAGVDVHDPRLALSDLPVTNNRVVAENFDRCFSDPRISRKALDEYFAEPFDLRRRFLGRYLAFHTSGSTGNPSYVVWSERELGIATCMWFSAEFEYARSRREFRKQILQRPSRIAYIGVLDDYIGGNSWADNLRHFAKVLMLSIFESSSTIDRELQVFLPDAIISKPHVLAKLASRHSAGLVDLKSVRRAFAVGQNILTTDVETIHKGFGVVPRNSYSACETGPIAKQLTDEPGLRIFTSQIICELLDETGAPIEVPDVVGKVVVTSLYNTVMPVIRYEVGDLASYAAGEGSEPTLLRSVHGRNTADIRFRSGDREFSVPEYVLWELHVPGVERYQVIQKSALEIEVLVELGEGVEPVRTFDLLRAKLVRTFRRCQWSDEIKLEFRAVPHIQADSSGKIRITVPFDGERPVGS